MEMTRIVTVQKYQTKMKRGRGRRDAGVKLLGSVKPASLASLLTIQSLSEYVIVEMTPELPVENR